MDQSGQMPPLASHTLKQQLIEGKKNLEIAFKEYHKLINDKVLDQNKSAAVKNVEAQTVGNLIKAAATLDNINMGEGILSLASVAIREHLMVRDRVNELEFELCILLRDFNKLKEKVEGPNATTKK